MARPTTSDPLGQRPDGDDTFASSMMDMIDRRIEVVTRGRAFQNFSNVADVQLATELIARGWVVYKPREMREQDGVA